MVIFVLKCVHQYSEPPPPPPTWSNDPEAKGKREKAAEYILATFLPWNRLGTVFHYNLEGLFCYLEQSDKLEATIIEKQRCRYIRNVLKKGFRNSTNEETCTDWRNRNVDYWNDGNQPTTSQDQQKNDDCDPELKGKLKDNLYELLSKVTSGSARLQLEISSIESFFWSMVPEHLCDEVTNRNHNDCIYKLRFTNGVSIQEAAKMIQQFKLSNDTSSDRHMPETVVSISKVSNETQHALSRDQQQIFDRIMEGIDSNRYSQSLVLIHGGGGTGKSYLLRKITEEITKRNLKVVSTCPTGAGACQLIDGMTFHSALKCNTSTHLSNRSKIALRELFTQQVVLVIIDEISMLTSNQLLLLDQRLRMLYNANKVFGGISIVLVSTILLFTIISKFDNENLQIDWRFFSTSSCSRCFLM